MKANLIDHMGNDLTVVNAARVSFAKKHKAFEPDDAKLINYLAKHNHWTPFAHVQLQFHMQAPIFVARQLAKSQTGAVWNEVSRRYVDNTPEFFTPTEWRSRAENAKQGSGDPLPPTTQNYINDMLESHHAESVDLYDDLLNAGVCPEQARMVLPQSMYTEWWWTGSLYFFARVCKLRLDSHTQAETTVLAKQIAEQAGQVAPVSWAALMGISSTES